MLQLVRQIKGQKQRQGQENDFTAFSLFSRETVRLIEQDIKRRYEVSVILFLSEEKDSEAPPVLTIVRLLVSASDRRQGLGSMVMNELCRHADAHGWAMRLDASSRFGTDERVLTAFYSGFGFDLSGSVNEDGEPSMERPALVLTA